MAQPIQVTCERKAIFRFYKIAVGVCFGLMPALAMANPAGCLDAPAVLASPTLTVASLNVAHGRRQSFNQLLLSRQAIESNLGLVAAQLQNSGAEVVALQEADAASGWSGDFDHVQLLAGSAGLPCYFHGLHDQSRLSSYGTALLSRYALFQTASQTFAPSWPTKPKGFVVSRLHWNPNDKLDSALEVVLVSLHLDFSRASVRNSQAAELIAALQDVTGPLVVMGDFNAEWAESDSAVRTLAQALSLQAYEPEVGNQGTYVGKHKRLDWILISSQLKFVNHRVIPEVVSDHLTVVAELALVEVLL
ncbi:endonuclease/exonuclease/phosphatase family protein [Candidatus Litorirhabdus singularis]|nr:endonuclease/exonuclease/phosphatase family protein [Candidatus Litorirhabdus singularis]